MTNELFLPYGAQYYRAPTPPASDWARDLEGMARNGFNSVKFWVQWRWNNPLEDEYDFRDIDTLMDLSQKFGLKVFLNIIYDVAPVWLFDKYPDCLMVTLEGRKIFPTSTPCRQIGGSPGPCYNHPQALEARMKFTREVIKRYSNHPAMAVWDLWNEPELCYNTRSPVVGNLVCYCDNCRNAFHGWLHEKYKDIAELNRVWGRNYRSFSEVELPREPRTIKDMIDWRVFFHDVLAKELEMRAKVTRGIDTIHPVMTHTVNGFNKINGCDDYKMAKLMDWFGGSTNIEPYPNRSFVSFSGGKRTIAAEIHANGGNTVNRGAIKSFKDYKKLLLMPLAMGHSGFLYWQYRCELLGKESPMWGLTDPAGNDAEQMEYAKKIGKALEKVKDIIIDGERPLSRVGILYDARGEIFNWCTDYSTQTYFEAIQGAHDVFFDIGVNADIVDVAQAKEGGLGQYKVIYCPFPYYMDRQTAHALRQWTAEGGLLISESCFGGYCDDDGRHAKVIPGFAMNNVFGCRVNRATSTTRFLHSYDDFAGIDKTNKPYVRLNYQGISLKGDVFIEELIPHTADVLAVYENSALAGAAAVTSASFGQGCAVMIGTLMSTAYHNLRDENTRGFIKDLTADFLPEAEVTADEQGIKCDLYIRGHKALIIVYNHTPEKRSVRLTLPGRKVLRAEDMLDDGETRVEEGCVHMAAEADEYKLIFAELDS